MKTLEKRYAKLCDSIQQKPPPRERREVNLKNLRVENSDREVTPIEERFIRSRDIGFQQITSISPLLRQNNNRIRDFTSDQISLTPPPQLRIGKKHIYPSIHKNSYQNPITGNLPQLKAPNQNKYSISRLPQPQAQKSHFRAPPLSNPQVAFNAHNTAEHKKGTDAQSQADLLKTAGKRLSQTPLQLFDRAKKMASREDLMNARFGKSMLRKKGIQEQQRQNPDPYDREHWARSLSYEETRKRQRQGSLVLGDHQSMFSEYTKKRNYSVDKVVHDRGAGIRSSKYNKEAFRYYSRNHTPILIQRLSPITPDEPSITVQTILDSQNVLLKNLALKLPSEKLLEIIWDLNKKKDSLTSRLPYK